MSVFYSTIGNPEIWDVKPEGYFESLEDWQAANPPTPEEIVAAYDAAIDERLETFARELYSKGYANAVTYVNSASDQWRLEAEYLIALRDETWQAAYVYMNEVMPQVVAGERPVPTLEEVFAALPAPAWPEGSRGYAGG